MKSGKLYCLRLNFEWLCFWRDPEKAQLALTLTHDMRHKDTTLLFLGPHNGTILKFLVKDQILYANSFVATNALMEV